MAFPELFKQLQLYNQMSIGQFFIVITMSLFKLLYLFG